MLSLQNASRRRLVLVFSAALLVRGVVFGVGPFQDPARAVSEDSSHYIALARNLVDHGQFGVPLAQQTAMAKMIADLESRIGGRSRETAGLAPETFRTPGYPAFLAVASLGLRDFRLAIVVQCVLGALSAMLITLLAARLGASTNVATAAGVAWALHPALVAYDNLLLTEGLFNFLVVVTALLATVTSRPFGLAIAGTVLGCASLVRPPLGLFYLPVLLAVSWHRGARSSTLALAVACALMPPALWAIRNASVGEGLRFSTVADYSLIFYTAPCAISESRGEDCDRAYPRRHAEIARRLENRLRPGDDVLEVARQDAVGDLMAHGSGAARMYAKSVVKLATSHSMGTFAHVLGVDYQPSGLFSRFILGEQTKSVGTGLRSTMLALGWTLLNAMIACLALAGLAIAARERRVDMILGFAACAVLFGATVGAVGQERIRLPMMLPLLMLCSVALTALPARLRQQSTLAAAPGAPAVLGFRSPGLTATDRHSNLKD